MRPTALLFHCRAGSSLRVAMLLVTAIMLAAPPAAARSKPASCQIVSEGRVAFSGRCRFTVERGGSFSLSRLRGHGPLYRSIWSVSVTLVGRGVAEVRGLTNGGINSRWGRAVRSKRDPAC